MEESFAGFNENGRRRWEESAVTRKRSLEEIGFPSLFMSG